MSEYYTISELSRDYSIPITTLRYYQRSGLLNPVIRGQNNYGYYSAEQLSQLELITFLRELDIPVRTIRHIVSDNLDHAEIMEILLTHRDALLDEIRELTYRVEKINSTQHLYDIIRASSWNPEENQVNIRHLGIRLFLTRKLSKPLTGTGDAWHLKIKQYNTPVLESGNYAAAIYSMGAISDISEIDDTFKPNYHSVYCEPTTRPRNLEYLDDFTLVSKDPGDYLAVRYHNNEENRTAAYRQLISYIRSNNIRTEPQIFDGIVNCFLPPTGNSPRTYELHVKLV